MIPLKDNLSCKVFPWVTLALIALNCIAFGIELMVPNSGVEAFFSTWAVVPANISHAFASGSPALIGMAMLSVLTAMFLHGGWMHIFGNMVFLQAFGRAVEARLGSFKFALFYLVGGYAAWGLHMFIDPTSPVPALGASGAIAAVLGAYLVFYPKAKFKTLFFAPLPILAVVYAFWILPEWFLVQVMSGVGSVSGAEGGGVAYWAHIGGFLFGLIFAASWMLWKPFSEVCYTPISCACDCKDAGHNHCCKKDHVHKFQILKFWKF